MARVGGIGFHGGVGGKKNAMSIMQPTAAFTTGAIVSKVDPIAHADRYLHVTDIGSFEWVGDPQAATPFASMREAARMAVRLPATQRAFGVPLHH
jgi:hypothetical protein